MLGATGLGAMLGGIMMPWLNGRLSRDSQIMLGGLLCSATLLPVALLSSTEVTGCAMIVFGCGWILAASNLLATVQLASAPWVRARCVAVYQAIFNGGMGFGAITWGWLAESAGLSGTLLAAGLGGIGMALVSRTYPLSDEIIDPSLPSPVTPPTVIAHDIMLSDLEASRHSVVVTIAYQVNHEDADAFRAAMSNVAAARRRDGATAWTLGRDVELPGCWLETFRIPDWWELHRGIARMNLVDGAATRAARGFHRGERPPDVRVMVIEQV
jgi:MFS family permease